MRVFSTPKPRLNENKSCVRVDWISGIKNSHQLQQNLNQLKVDERLRVGGQMRALVATLISFSFDRGFKTP